MKTVLTDHAQNRSPVANDKLKTMVENLNGQLYKDKRDGGYHLVQGRKVAVIRKDRNTKVIVTSFANLQDGTRYQRKKRFKPADKIR